MAILARFNSTVQDSQGNVVPRAKIEVRQSLGTRSLVVLYSDRAGTQTLGNPFEAGDDGQFFFNVAGGAYRVRAYTGDSLDPTFETFWDLVPVGNSQELDADQLGQYLSAGIAPFPTKAALDATTPTSGYTGAIVLNDPDATKNGWYTYNTGTSLWVKRRGLPDTIAQFTVTGGDANNIIAVVSPGIDPGVVKMYYITPPLSNTGPMTINAKPLKNALGVDLVSGEYPANRISLVVDEGSQYRLLSDPDIAGVAVQVLAAAAEVQEIADQFGDLSSAMSSINAAVISVEDSASDASDSATAAATARDSAFLNTNVANSFTEGVGYSAATTGSAAYFWVRKGGVGSSGVPLSRQTLYQRTGVSTANAIATIPDASEFDAEVSLLSTQVQTIGRSVAPVAALTTGNNSFFFADPVSTDCSIAYFEVYAQLAGTYNFGVFVKSGTTMTRVRDVPFVVAAPGLVRVSFEGNSLPVAAGSYIGLYLPSALSYTAGAADGAGWWQDASGSPKWGATVTIENGGPRTTSGRLEARLSFRSQPLTGEAFKVAQAAIATNTIDIATQQARTSQLLGTVLQTLGRPVDPIDGSVVSSQVYIQGAPVVNAGPLQSLKVFVKALAPITIHKGTLVGTTWTRTGFVTFTPTSLGLQTFTAADFGVLNIAANEHLGVSGNGTFTFTTQSADAPGWYQRNPDAGGPVGALNTGQRLQYQLVVAGIVQTVTAAAIAALIGASNGRVIDPLYGKKIVAIGDSMTKGHTLPDNQTWLSLLANHVGASYINYGVNGIYMSNTDYAGQQGVVMRYGAMDNDADYVIVFAGTNDAANGVPLGAANSVVNTEFNGALNVLIPGLITKYPGKKICFITPYRRNSNYPAYVDAMKARCAEHAVPVFDNIVNGGVDWGNAAQVAALTLSDTYHLSQSGMIYAETKYEHFLRSL